MEHPPAIDRETLARILEDLGDDAPDLFDQLTELFLSDTPQLLQGLKEAANRHDFAEASRSAHRLKGSSAQMGALTLARHAEAAEMLAGLTDPTLLEQMIEQMETDWRHAASEFGTLRDSVRKSAGLDLQELIKRRPLC